MSKINDGGPVHPGSTFNEEGFVSGYHPGMSLRDWFAGQALAGLTLRLNLPLWPEDQERAARSAYILADAMLAARAKEPGA